jgi:hypothetical protein
VKTGINYPATSADVRAHAHAFRAIVLLSLMIPAAASSQLTPVDLGVAGSFRILAKTGITATGETSITGNIGVSPAPASTISGFGLVMVVPGTVSTSSLVTGNVYAADYAVPTPANLSTAVNDMEVAYADAAGRTAPDHSDLGAGEIGGLVLAPGLYKWGTGVTLANDVTLNGNSSAVWIFQVAGALNISDGTKVFLTGGAQSSNIFWQVAGQVTLGTSSVMKGIILSRKAIVMKYGAIMDGRVFAQTTVVLDTDKSLQVELVSFTATANSSGSHLDWSTSKEANNYGFDIERRQTGSWEKLAFVPGAGSSTSPKYYSYTDNNLSPGQYSYRIKQVNSNGTFSYHGSAEVDIVSSPQAFTLTQNYPNPFNPTTKIEYSLQKAGMVSLKVYNVLGDEVVTLVNGPREAGSHAVPFNAQDLASGVYFYRLQVGTFVSTKKLILMK